MKDKDGNPSEGRITVKQAKGVLPPRVQNIHTLIPSSMGPVGATWRRKQVVSLMEKHPIGVYLSGPRMRAMGHGLAILRPEKKSIFVETDSGRLEQHFPASKHYSADDYIRSGMRVPQEVRDGEA